MVKPANGQPARLVANSRRALLRVRTSRAKEIEIGSGGTIQVMLTVASID